MHDVVQPGRNVRQLCNVTINNLAETMSADLSRFDVSVQDHQPLHSAATASKETGSEPHGGSGPAPAPTPMSVQQHMAVWIGALAITVFVFLVFISIANVSKG